MTAHNLLYIFICIALFQYSYINNDLGKNDSVVVYNTIYRISSCIPREKNHRVYQLGNINGKKYYSTLDYNPKYTINNPSARSTWNLSTWENNFSSLLTELHQTYKYHKHHSSFCGIDDSLQSNLFAYTLPSHYLNVIEAENICVSMFYKDFILIEHNNSSFARHWKKKGFRAGWPFRWSINYPKNYQWSNLPNPVISMFPFQHHIYHVLEGFGSLLIKLLEPDLFPCMNSIIFPKLYNDENHWITEMYLSFKHLFPKTVSFFTSDDILSIFPSEYVCFHRATLVDRLTEPSDGGFLPGYAGVDLIRAIVYKDYGLVPKYTQCNELYTLTLFRRTHTRRWENTTQIVTLLRRYFSDSIKVRIENFASSHLYSQARSWLETDIALTPHGAGMTNLIFMLPYSVVIEVPPPNFSEFLFSNLAFHSRIYYILIKVFIDRKGVDMEEVEHSYWHNNYMQYRHYFKNDNVEIRDDQLNNALLESLSYLNTKRCGKRPVLNKNIF